MDRERERDRGEKEYRRGDRERERERAYSRERDFRDGRDRGDYQYYDSFDRGGRARPGWNPAPVRREYPVDQYYPPPAELTNQSAVPYVQPANRYFNITISCLSLYIYNSILKPIFKSILDISISLMAGLDYTKVYFYFLMGVFKKKGFSCTPQFYFVLQIIEIANKKELRYHYCVRNSKIKLPAFKRISMAFNCKVKLCNISFLHTTY